MQLELFFLILMFTLKKINVMVQFYTKEPMNYSMSKVDMIYTDFKATLSLKDIYVQLLNYPFALEAKRSYGEECYSSMLMTS